MSGKPRILIVGNAGQVGRELQRTFADCGPIVGVDRESIDIAVPEQVRELVRRVDPQIILNAAAYTAVDRAEAEPELAMAINADAVRTLAEEALRLNALLVHYSTDYVFDGEKLDPWTETDEPNPLSVYGRTKLAGERAIQDLGGRYLIFRTSWVYGPHGHNFLFTMLRLGRERDRLSIVDDQRGAPTTSIELAEATRTIVSGVLDGQFGGVGFAQAIFARAGGMLEGKTPELLPIATKDYPTPAKRPRNSVLSNAKLRERFGVRLASWPAALDAVFEALGSAKAQAGPTPVQA
jgi:dTDP-4-dehydrorhamnose reductase